jgi:hypothetical protein
MQIPLPSDTFDQPWADEPGSPIPLIAYRMYEKKGANVPLLSFDNSC